MGCGPIICGKETYNYTKQKQLIRKVMSQFTHLSHCYSHQFVIKCHKNMLLDSDSFILKYQKFIQQKQNIPHTILEKWKLILYGTNTQIQHYADCIGFDKHFQQQRISSKTYRFSKRNPHQIRLQDLYFHQSYRQIQKDSNRVYLVPQIKQQLFQKLLKKISNHFPQSGYSLGINYIIGYFLLIGMSEMDSFWIFVHLALNEKYLALGMFENQLPLTKVLIQIFKNILRRKNKQLFKHIYKNLQIDDNAWLLKWITSFYLSTFPIQFSHYIFDYIISFGILGFSIIAYVVVNYYQNQIFKCEEVQDFDMTLKEVLSFEYLSKNVHIQKFMSLIYEVNLHQNDFYLLSQIGDNFYVKYFVLYCEWKFKNVPQARQKINQLLSNWYSQNIHKRQSFTKFAKSFDGKFYTQHKNIQVNSNEQQNKDKQKDQNKQKQIIDEVKSEKTNKTSKMQITKQQKIQQQKTQQKIQIPQQLINNDSKQQKQNYLQIKSQIRQRVRTIKVSSKHKKYSQKDSSFQNQSKQSRFKIQYSNIKNFNTKNKQIIRVKSEGFIQFKQNNIKKLKSQNLNERVKQRNYEQLGNNKSVTSLKSYINEDNVSDGQININFGGFNKNISQKDFSKTLPIRKHSDYIKSKFIQNNMQNIQNSIKNHKIKEYNMDKQLDKQNYEINLKMNEINKDLQQIWKDQEVNKQIKDKTIVIQNIKTQQNIQVQSNINEINQIYQRNIINSQNYIQSLNHLQNPSIIQQPVKPQQIKSESIQPQSIIQSENIQYQFIPSQQILSEQKLNSQQLLSQINSSLTNHNHFAKSAQPLNSIQFQSSNLQNVSLQLLNKNHQNQKQNTNILQQQ